MLCQKNFPIFKITVAKLCCAIVTSNFYCLHLFCDTYLYIYYWNIWKPCQIAYILVYILKDKHSSKTLPVKSYVLSSFCKIKALIMRARPHKTPIIHNSGKNMQTEISVALKKLPFMNFYRVFVGSCNSAFIPIQFWYSQLPLTNVLGLNSLVKILQIMSRPKY